MKKILLAFLSLLGCVQAGAYDVEIDGIYYKLNAETHEAEVTYEIDSYNSSYSGDVVIPASIIYSEKTYNVTSIGDNAFYGCMELTSMEIPNSVTSIGSRAFYGCVGLTSMTIPNSVTSIGDYAFCSCYKLSSITIPNSVTSIGSGAFSYCSGLTSVLIPNSVTSIGDGAFMAVPTSLR